MGFSLYSATIPSNLQILGALSGVIAKADAFCTERGLAPAALIEARLAEDMHPFAYQVKSAAVHSAGAIEGVRSGAFSPDTSVPPDSFAGFQDLLAKARATLEAIDPAEVDGLVGRDMAFVVGDRRIPFTAENFLLSFSQPNFYFHATTAYAILRGKGVQIGKRDFLGQLRIAG